jgi:hypothetical protein
VQPEKDSALRVSTDDGMQIDESDEHFEKALDAISERLPLDSKLTVDS